LAYLLSRDALLAILAGNDANPVVQWSLTVRNEEIFVCALTLGEVEAAAQALPAAESAKRQRYADLLDREIPRVFGGRILTANITVAREWGRVKQQAQANGIQITAEEAMEIATVRLTGYQYVTTTKPHHAWFGVTVVEP
jgi:predicted nucleic acid-binding protein